MNRIVITHPVGIVARRGRASRGREAGPAISAARLRARRARRAPLVLALKRVVASAGLLLTTTAWAETVTWIGQSGFWDTEGNWDIRVPLAADNAVIGVAGAYVVTVAAGGEVNSITAAADKLLRLAGGTLVIHSASSLGGFEMLDGALAGRGAITVSGNAVLTGGLQARAGSLTLLSTTSVFGDGIKLDSRRLLVNGTTGTMTWTSGSIELDHGTDGVGGGTLLNQGALLAVGNGTSHVLDTWGLGVFNNSGTFVKQGSTADHETSVAAVFNNTGSVQVQTGRLRLMDSGVHSGSFEVEQGAEVLFSGSAHVLESGSSLAGSGVYRLEGGSLTANRDLSVTDLVQQGGTIAGLGHWTVGSFIHAGGKFDGGNLDVSGAASLSSNANHSGAYTTTLRGLSAIDNGGVSVTGARTLRNAASGTVNWTAGDIVIGGDSVFHNEGRFVASGDAAFDIQDARGQFLNSGTFEKSGNSASGHTTTVFAAFTNSGQVTVLTGHLELTQAFVNQGVVEVAAGARLLVSNDSFINAGLIAGDGTVATRNLNSALVNAGNLAPGTGRVGTLTVLGDLVQEASGKYIVELSSLLGADLLQVYGDGSLAGSLEIIGLIDGSPVPGIGEMFTIMTFDDGLTDGIDLSGGFDRVSWTGFHPSIGFAVAYLDNAVVLQVTAVPQPPVAWLFSAGLAIVLRRFRRREV